VGISFLDKKLMKKYIIIFQLLFSTSLLAQQIDIINPEKEIGLNNWRIVNDNVMGGVSKSNLYLNESGNLIFSGDVSLDNNGGFASCRLAIDNVSLEGISSFKIRVKGDGNTYKFRVSERYSSINYSSNFKTIKEKWVEINIPLEKLEPTFMGYYSSRAPRLKIENMKSIGFLISDKQEGSFNLEIMLVEGIYKDKL
jgi:monofunctional biosynthetic peptidoglycan transglycosylase